MSQVFQRDRQMRCQKASKRKPPRSNGIRRPLSSACTRLSQLLAPSSASPTSRSTPCGRRPPAFKGFVNAQVRYLPATTITELSRTSGRATAARKPDHACPMGIACRPVSTLSVVLTGRLARLPRTVSSPGGSTWERVRSTRRRTPRPNRPSRNPYFPTVLYLGHEAWPASPLVPQLLR